MEIPIPHIKHPGVIHKPHRKPGTVMCSWTFFFWLIRQYLDQIKCRICEILGFGEKSSWMCFSFSAISSKTHNNKETLNYNFSKVAQIAIPVSLIQEQQEQRSLCKSLIKLISGLNINISFVVYCLFALKL